MQGKIRGHEAIISIGAVLKGLGEVHAQTAQVPIVHASLPIQHGECQLLPRGHPPRPCFGTHVSLGRLHMPKRARTKNQFKFILGPSPSTGFGSRTANSAQDSQTSRSDKCSSIAVLRSLSNLERRPAKSAMRVAGAGISCIAPVHN